MRLGLVVYGSLSAVSGGYLYDRMLAGHLRSRGDAVEVISLPRRGYAASLLDNFSSRTLRRLLDGKWDLLLEDELNHPSLVVMNRRVKERCRVPIVAVVHHLRCSEPGPGWRRACLRSIEGRFLRTVDGCVFNSDHVRRAVSRLRGIDLPSVTAYPGRNSSTAVPDEASLARRVLRPGPFTLIFVGNVIRRKGLHVLIDALSRLAGMDWRLDIVGDLSVEPRYARSVRARAEKRGILGRVSFLGALSGEELSRRLQESKALAVPSLYEGLGIVYMEAMGCGLPAIATAAGGAGELVTDGMDGYLIPPGDAALLAEKIRALASDRRLLLRMSLNAAGRARRFPSWDESMAGVRAFLLEQVSAVSTRR